jgi:hypothetical protein
MILYDFCLLPAYFCYVIENAAISTDPVRRKVPGQTGISYFGSNQGFIEG